MVSHGEGGLNRSSEYNSWAQMKDRCNNPNNPSYKHYGGRGIKVSWEFDEYIDFLAIIGRKPDSSYTLDRIDNDGNYEPSNCRWATKAEQQQNTSQTKLTWEDVCEIREMSQRFDDKAIALEFGISISQTNKIRNNKSWIRGEGLINAQV